ncbi:MAG: alternative ribosome rescue aminoacyl-tRNA hydrolase ArfB [Gammaproteobacteria bacterium]
MEITATVSIDDALLEERFIRASGPGGQHVNKVSTAVQIRFPVDRCTTLAPDVRMRLKQLAGTRINRNGTLILTANQHRSQVRNRDEVRERLARLIRRALIKPTVRKAKRKPTANQRKKRVDAKRQRGSTKRLRKTPPRD